MSSPSIKSQLNNLQQWKCLLSQAMHIVLGLFMFLRCLIVDSLWFWPRQPLSFMAMIVLPRALTVNLPPMVYDCVSLFFDGDVTPLVLLVSWVTLFLTGSFKWERLWTNAGGFKRLCTISLLFLGPISWCYKIYQYEVLHANVVDQVNGRFNDSEDPMSENDRVYNVVDHVTNAHGGQDLLKPDMTFVYKQVDLNTLEECPNDGFMPGDVVNGKHRLHEEGILELDVYKPFNAPSNGDKPGIILHIHGGGWKAGHRGFLGMNYHGGVPHSILEKNMIVSVSYRLSCNGVDGNEMLQDLYDATKFVIDNAEEWGADGSKIIPWGTSAGGNLALLLAYRFKELKFKGVINFYGITELREKELSSLSATWYETFFNYHFTKETRHICTSATNQEKCFEDMSPVNHVSKESPPTLTVHGKQDGLVLSTHANLLSNALTKFNVTHASLVVPGHHDCDVHVSSPCSQAAIHAIRKLTALVF